MINPYNYEQDNNIYYTPPIPQKAFFTGTVKFVIFLVVAVVTVLFAPIFYKDTSLAVNQAIFIDYGNNLLITASEPTASGQATTNYIYKQSIDKRSRGFLEAPPFMVDFIADEVVMFDVGENFLIVTTLDEDNQGRIPIELHMRSDTGDLKTLDLKLFAFDKELLTEEDSNIVAASWQDRAVVMAVDENNIPCMVHVKNNDVNVTGFSQAEWQIDDTLELESVLFSGGSQRENTDYHPYFKLSFTDETELCIPLWLEEDMAITTDRLPKELDVEILGEDTEEEIIEDEEEDIAAQMQRLIDEIKDKQFSYGTDIGSIQEEFDSNKLLTPAEQAVGQIGLRYYEGINIPYIEANVNNKYYAYFSEGEEDIVLFNKFLIVGDKTEHNYLSKYPMVGYTPSGTMAAFRGEVGIIPQVYAIEKDLFLISGCTKNPSLPYGSTTSSGSKGDWVWLIVNGNSGELVDYLTLTGGTPSELKAFADAETMELATNYEILIKQVNGGIRKLEGEYKEVTLKDLSEYLREKESLFQRIMSSMSGK